MLAAFLRKVYRGFDTSDDIEPAMWREVLRIVNSATVEGLADAGTPPTHEADFYAALRHSNEVFAAFKVHNMGRLMASKLFGADGKLKPFNKWAEEVEPITSHHVGAWLRTEYDTALIRAHNAADWRRFERDKDVMPNLRWMPTTSPTPESSHRAFWERRLTLPVDDPFWNRHHPGDRWNCKCSLEQTDGHTFNDTHPYFPDSCAKCDFYRKANIKNRLLGGFTNRQKDCYNCPYIDGCIDRAKDFLRTAKETTKKYGHGRSVKFKSRIERIKADIEKEVRDRLPRKVGITAVTISGQNFRDAGWGDNGLHRGKTLRQQGGGPDAKYTPLTSRRDHLMRSVQYEQTAPGEVTVTDPVPYAAIHNDGGTLNTHPSVTPRCGASRGPRPTPSPVSGAGRTAQENPTTINHKNTLSKPINKAQHPPAAGSGQMA